MEPKREPTSVDLRALATELNAYAGATLDKAYLYPDDLCRLKMRDYDRGRVELLVGVGERKRVHTVDPEDVPDAPERPPEFAKILRTRVSGATFAGVEQYGFDRILSFEFERPDGDTTLVAELFGDGNLAVLDETGRVVTCLRTVRLKSRTVAPGSDYEFPEARVNPLALDRAAFGDRMAASDTDVVRTLATQLNLGGLWAEELCTRAGVGKTVPIAEADEEQFDAVYDALDRLRTDLNEGTFDPRVYFDPEDDGAGDDGGGAGDGGDGAGDADDGGGAGTGDAAGEDGSADDGGADDDDLPGRPVDVTPVPLEERSGLPARAYDTFDRAVAAYARLDAEYQETATEEAVDRPDFEAEIEKRERIIEQQEGAIENFDRQAEARRAEAEALYAHYGLVDEVIRTVRAAREDGVPWSEIAERFAEGADRGIRAAEAVTDVDGAEGTVTLDLEGTAVTVDPEEGVEHNADRLYREAKRVEEKREGAIEAVERTREELAEWRQRRERWEAGDAPGVPTDGAGGGDADAAGDGEDGDEPESVDWLTRPSIPVHRPEHWYERFRWFHTSGDFLVLGGRDADDNEELVDKYLERGDLFFHTQARGGPATVLKAAGPSESARDVTIPDRDRAEAARFAVSYSSVWKDGAYAGDVYAVSHDQVSKTPESGEYLEKGGFAVRGDRTYYRDVPVGVAVGITCEPETRVIGGPPDPVEARAETVVHVEPGEFAQGDVAKRAYREFRERFRDTSLVRNVASPDRIAHFLPPGTSRLVEE